MSYALWFSTYVKEQYCITSRRQKNRQNGCMSKKIELVGGYYCRLVPLVNHLILAR